MLPLITGLPEVPDPRGTARRALLHGVLLLLFVIVIFPFVRMADTARLLGLELPPVEAGVAHYRRIALLACLLACAATLAAPLRAWLRALPRGALAAAFGWAVAVYALLAVLAFPYPWPDAPYADASGLGGIGRWYGGEMAPSPFTMVSEIGYRRMLMPALAHYLGLTRMVDYYLFSQLVAVSVIALLVLFLREQVPVTNRWPAAARLLLYASLCSGSWYVFNAQMPGYPDILLFGLLLLLLLVPMPAPARLTLVALAMITHEGALFGLVPLVLAVFPRRERLPALILIGTYVALWLLSYGPGLRAGLAGHDVVGEASHRGAYLSHPQVALAGVFLAWKLLWFPALAWLALALRAGPLFGRLTAAALVLLPLSMLAIAWDTTRLAAFGFAGMLLILAAMGRRWLGPRPGALVWLLLGANLLIPPNNIVLARVETAYDYPYPGAYRLLYPHVEAPPPAPEAP